MDYAIDACLVQVFCQDRWQLKGGEGRGESRDKGRRVHKPRHKLVQTVNSKADFNFQVLVP